MKQNISPKVLIPVIAAALLILGVAIARVMNAPSSVPAPGVDMSKPVPPTAGAGPTEEDLKRMREYNAANPGAASSRR